MNCDVDKALNVNVYQFVKSTTYYFDIMPNGNLSTDIQLY